MPNVDVSRLDRVMDAQEALSEALRDGLEEVTIVGKAPDGSFRIYASTHRHRNEHIGALFSGAQRLAARGWDE